VTRPDRGEPGRRACGSAWHRLLAVPVVVPLAVPLYNRLEPALFGLPFFYWCQLAFVALASSVTAAVHLLTRRGR
jgi:hypothetical protein